MANPDFVVIAGVSLKVLVDTGYEDEPEVQGNWRRLGDGSAQSSERDPKRGFAFVAQFDPPSTFDTLRDLISVAGQPGVPSPVEVTSPVDGLTRGATLQCWCRLGRAQYRTKGAGIFKTSKMTAPVTLKEA